jgi:hypothetical protein
MTGRCVVRTADSKEVRPLRGHALMLGSASLLDHRRIPRPKSDCLDRIDRMWTDLRQLSLRAAHRTEVPN